MRQVLSLFICLLLAPTLLQASDIRPFTSDGCSRFPDGTPERPELWRDCCVAHDRSYWQGGSYQERMLADRALQVCVTERGATKISELMFIGVRMGGSPFWPTDYRWGYGWPYLRGYRPLTGEEHRSIQRQLEKAGIK